MLYFLLHSHTYVILEDSPFTPLALVECLESMSHFYFLLFQGCGILLARASYS